MNRKTQNKNDRKKTFLKTYIIFLGREKVLNAFDSKIFPIKIERRGFSDSVSDHSNLEILAPKQMLERLPIVFAQVKAGNTSENLLNEIRQIVCSSYWAKEITEKVYNNIVNSIKV